MDINTVPDNLRQYVVGTPEWMASPWMTAPTCKDHGGDWSIYTQHVIRDTPALLQFFQPDFGGDDPAGPARGQEILAGYRAIANQISVPTGYCVDKVRQWAHADSTYKPFGFDWGNAPATSRHTSDYTCTNNVGADNAPCGGFYIGCGGAIAAQDSRECQAWNGFSDGYVTRVNAARRHAQDAVGQAPVDTVIKSPSEIAQDILNWTVQHGMAQVTSFVIDGVTKLWAVFLQITVNYTTPDVTGNGFADVYNLVAGVALALAFLGWLVTLVTSWKQGRLQFALFGGIKAAVGVTLAGVGAILMLQLSDDCTASLARAGGNLAHQADFTTSLVKANPLVALVVGILIAIFVIFAIIFLVVHSALVLMWALFGSIAAAGQVHPVSSSWLWRWAGRLTALAWAKFAMVAVMLLDQALLLPLDAGEDTVKQVIDVIQGLALAFVLVSTPYLLWELVDFVGDRVGGAAASGGRATSLASTGAQRAGSVGGSAVTTAVSMMTASATEIGRRFTSSSTGGSDATSGTGSPKVPHSEPPNVQQPPATAAGARKSSEGGSARQPSGGTSPPVANRGRVYSGAPTITDLSPTTKQRTSSEGGSGHAGAVKPPVPPP